MGIPEARVTRVEAKVEEHDRRFAELLDLIRNLDAKIDRRFDLLDQRFTWVLGLQVTMLLALLTASLGALGVLLSR